MARQEPSPSNTHNPAWSNQSPERQLAVPISVSHLSLRKELLQCLEVKPLSQSLTMCIGLPLCAHFLPTLHSLFTLPAAGGKNHFFSVFAAVPMSCGAASLHTLSPLCPDAQQDLKSGVGFSFPFFSYGFACPQLWDSLPGGQGGFWELLEFFKASFLFAFTLITYVHYRCA